MPNLERGRLELGLPSWSSCQHCQRQERAMVALAERVKELEAALASLKDRLAGWTHE